MTPLEQRAVRALARVKTFCDVRDRHFIRWLGCVLQRAPQLDLSPGGRRWLWRLVVRYKKQIDDAELVPLALAGGESPFVVNAHLTQPSMFI